MNIPDAASLKLSIIIPGYNEKNTIENIVNAGRPFVTGAA